VAPTEALVEAVLRQTGGNPFFIKELVRLGADISQGTCIPQSVREVIGRRLDGLSADCDAMLSVAAVIGPEFAVGVLERVTGLPRERLLELVDESVRERLVMEIAPASGRHAFAHVLFRDVLYAELPATRRVALHRRVGEALEQLYAAHLDDHLTELAFHFKQAAPGGEVAKAVTYGLRAGHRATAATAHEEAARCYESVLELLELAAERDESARCEGLLCLSEAVWRSGSFQKARAISLQAFETARVLRAPTQMARAALNVSGRALVFGGSPDRKAVAVLEEALLATGDAEPCLSALLSAQIARELTLAEAPNTLWTLTGEAIRRARSTGDPAVLAFVLKATYWPLYGVTRPEERLRVACEIVALADRVGDRALAVEGRVLAFLGYVEVGDRAAAIAELDTCTRVAERLRQPDLLWLVTLVRGCWVSGQGLLDEFERLSQDARALGQENPAALFFFGFQYCFSATLRGRFSEVEQLLLSHAGNFPPMMDSYRALLTVIYATAGRTAEARAELERFAARNLAGLPRNVLWTGVMTNLATACFLVGDAPRAAELYPLLASYAGQLLAPLAVCLGSMDRSLGQLAATMRRWHDAERHFEVALDTNQRMQQWLHLAFTRADYARMLAERGDPADRVKIDRLLTDSSTFLDSLGAVPVTSASQSGRDTHREECGAPDVRAPDVCAFHKEGEFWSVAYRGQVARLRHRKGFDYLAPLLCSPEREFAALDLVLDESSGPGASVTRAIAGNVGSALDRTAREQYRRRRAELQAELAEAERMNDTLRASRLQEEAALLAQHLASAIGLGGRHRRAGSAAERSRVTVTKGIRAAIRAIQRADPVLGRYLGTHVRTGQLCAYVPDLRHPVVFRPGGTSIPVHEGMDRPRR
jgi:tetratricopeptide (TPR) repeat protein